jgi:hypothetical protein
MEGIRMVENVVFSRSVEAGKKKYYLDVKLAKNNSRYLSIREVTQGDTPENRESRRLIIFKDGFTEFCEAFKEVQAQLAVKEKAAV